MLASQIEIRAKKLALNPDSLLDLKDAVGRHTPLRPTCRSRALYAEFLGQIDKLKASLGEQLFEVCRHGLSMLHNMHHQSSRRC